MKIISQAENQALLGYSENQTKLGFKDIGEKVDHKKAFGRIAIACPRNQVHSCLCF